MNVEQEIIELRREIAALQEWIKAHDQALRRNYEEVIKLLSTTDFDDPADRSRALSAIAALLQ